MKNLGFIGLGKMGGHMASRLKSKGWNVIGFDVDPKLSAVSSLKELIEQLIK